MFQFLRLATFCLLSIVPLSAAASETEVEDLSRLPKDAFLAEFETLLPEMLAAQKELFVRFDPEMAESAIDTGPVTGAERMAVACLWDAMNEQGQLEGLARQMLVGKTMIRMMSEQPDLDIVDFFMNPAVSEEVTADIPDAILSAMGSCGSQKASAHRMALGAEVWAAFAAAAAKRGYTN